jgi:hypothetical protein
MALSEKSEHPFLFPLLSPDLGVRIRKALFFNKADIPLSPRSTPTIVNISLPSPALSAPLTYLLGALLAIFAP